MYIIMTMNNNTMFIENISTLDFLENCKNHKCIKSEVDLLRSSQNLKSLQNQLPTISQSSKKHHKKSTNSQNIMLTAVDILGKILQMYRYLQSILMSC